MTFIFHDPTNSNAGINKAAINSHIAKSAHDRRRQTKLLQQCQREKDPEQGRFQTTLVFRVSRCESEITLLS